MAPQYLLTLAGSKKQKLNGIIPLVPDSWERKTVNAFKDAGTWTKEKASWAYDNLYPDAFKVDEYYDFVKEKAFDKDFWNRQYQAIKDDPVAFSYDITKKFIPDIATEYLEEYAIEPFLGQIEEIVQAYIRANYLGQIDTSIKNNQFLYELQENQLKLGLTKLSYDLESQLGFNAFYSNISNTVAEIAVTVISGLATPAVGALAYYPAYAMSFNYLQEVTRDLIYKLLKSIYSDFFEEQNKKISEALYMVNLDENKLASLVYSQFDFETYRFLEYEQPVNQLDTGLKRAIVNLIDPFKPLLASMNNEEQKSFEKISDYVFYMLWHKYPTFQNLVANPENEKQVQTFIAVIIWNKRAQMLNEMVISAEKLTPQGFASRNSQINKKALEMKDVLGRWEATKARGEFEAKLAQDRARWASEASASAVKAQEAKATAEIKQADGLKKVGTWGLGAFALLKLLS